MKILEDTTSLGHEGKGTAWQRVLWKKQHYPDNYIGPDFFRVTKKRES